MPRVSFYLKDETAKLVEFLAKKEKKAKARILAEALEEYAAKRKKFMERERALELVGSLKGEWDHEERSEAEADRD